MAEDKGGYRQINKSLNICTSWLVLQASAFDEYLNGQTANLQELADVEQITPRVLRILGQNPGKGTNVFVVGTGGERIIVDTGGGEPAWAALVESTLKAQNISISHVLLTHWHGDHTGGVPHLIAMYPHLKSHIHKNQPDKGQQDIADQQVWKVEGATVRAIHVPGHSTDHCCFVLEEEQALFTGDNVLGTGTSAVEDLGTFMNSLQRMYDQNCPRGYPAHGETIGNLPGKIKGELNTKFRRERQAMKALNALPRRGERSATVTAIVTEVYGDSLDEATRTLALEPFMEEVLRKLAGDDKVAFEKRGGKKKWFSLEAVTG
ncbi:hypothetical protein LTR56_017130 [Elasticomyces elasticus]|nr:hypothetical protein LTR56_017130 [Elasticomyces elasticus]KAK4908798.1 hypothetical protein LTR49_022364 [Elasticomyces elasticus]KAK5748800.1 hypothetical protein LTS12_021151 [Elasticomyces elasticus]